MTKTAKRNIIISAVLAIIMCASLITGATFALFTSESKVNIAVTSGKVSVVATVDEDSLKTYSGVELTGNAATDTLQKTAVNGTFTNGGTAAFGSVDTNVLTLDKMTPGDKVTFNITITNYSNVKVKYRTKIAVTGDDGLFAGLKFNIGGMTLKSSTAWKYLDPADDTVNGDTFAIYNCSVELPSDKGNEYQEKSCNIAYIVEAIQSNAATTEEKLNAQAEGNLTVTQANAEAKATVETTQSLSDSTMTVTYPVGTLLNTTEVSTGDDNVKKTAVTQSLAFESYSASTELSGAGVEILSGQAVAQYSLTLPVDNDNNELVTVTINYTSGLTGVTIYHIGVELPSTAAADGEDAREYAEYNAETGVITLHIFHACSIDIVYDKPITVTTADGLKAALEDESVSLIWLGADIELTEALDIKHSVTIETNGKTLTCEAQYGAFNLENGTNLTVAGGGEIKVSMGADEENGPQRVFNVSDKNSTLTVKDVTVTTDNGFIAVEAGTVVIEGGTYNITNGGVAVFAYGEDSKVIINGGTFTGVDKSEGAVYAFNGATVEVNDGIFNFVDEDGNVNWTLCDYSQMYTYSFNYGGVPVTGGGHISVKGGTFNKNVGQLSQYKYESTFSVVEINYVAEGYEATQNEDDTWTVSKTGEN